MGMGTKRMDLVIGTTFIDTGTQKAIREMEKMHRALMQLNLSSISVKSVTQSVFSGLGNVIQNTAGLVGKGVMGIGVHMQKLGAVFDAKGLGGFGKLFSGAGGILGGVGSAVAGLGKVLGPVVGILGAIGGIAIDVFGKVASVVGHVAQVIGGVLVSALEKAAAMAGVAGAAIAGVIGMTAKHGLEVRSTLQGAEVAFATILKSPQLAAGLMKDLQKEAKASAFDFLKLAQSGQSLLAFGYSAKSIIPTLKALGDAALVRGSDGAAERLERLVASFGKIKATGVLQGDEVNSLQEAGLNVREMLKIPVGLDFGQIKLQADQAIPQLLAGINQQFGGLQDRMAGMTAFMLSALTDNWDAFSAKITSGFGQRWDSALRRVLGLFDTLSNTEAGQRVTDALTRGFNLLGEAVDFVAAQLPGLISGFDQLVQSGRWDAFLNTVRGVFTEVWQFGVSVAQNIAANWGQIWPAISSIAVEALKVIGGTVAGLGNVFGEWFDTVAKGGDFFKALGTTVRDFADAAVVSMWHVGKQALELYFIFSSITTIVGILTKNLEMVGKGAAGVLASAAMKYKLDRGTADIRGQIAGMDVSKIGKDFQALAGQQGIGGAFARGFLGFGKQVDEFLAKMGRGVTVPLIPLSPVQAPAVTGAGSSVAGPTGSNVAAIQQQVKLLEEQAGAWGAIVDASKAYGGTLGDHARATRGVLTATLGHLGSLQQLHAAQKQLLDAQKPFTAEWFKSVEGVNKTAKEISGLTDAVRDLLFNTEKLNAATDLGGKLFDLAKDAGLDPKELQQIGAQQQAALLQTLDVERTRLGTLEKGSLEWLKQRSTIVDTIGKVVNLRKELDKANGAVSSQQLGFAKTPYGLRGAGVEPGSQHQDTDLSRMTRDLLKWAFNGPTVDLNREAARLQRGGGPLGELKGPAPATAAAVPSVTYTGNASIAFYGNINDAATVAKIAGEKAEQVVARALGQIYNQGQMRSPR